MNKRIAALFLALTMTLLLSGCFFKSVDELYALPKQSEKYYDLQEKIERLLINGAAYAAPNSGVNQQPVQLADLDGDDEEEAIVFLKLSGEKPLKAHIFDRVGDSFENIAVIDGDGNSFASVEYVQIDGEPGLEMVVGRQVSDQVMQSLSVYSLRENRVVELMSASYSEYTTVDLDSDGNMDIFLLRFNTEERTGVAEYYRSVANQIERDPEALMSVGAEVVKRIITGCVYNNVPAVFVASSYDESSIITDIFALRDGTFTNITTEGATGTSAQTIRNYYVYATDIDDDGVIELPQPKQLPVYGDAAPEDVYWIIDWYKLDINGTRRKCQTTYHNYSGGWYVILPDAWGGRVTISRGQEVSGVQGCTFALWNGYDVPSDEVFTIYAFSGDDRNQVAQEGNRFILAEKGDVTYAGELHGTAGVSREMLTGMFNFIQIDWNSGEV